MKEKHFMNSFMYLFERVEIYHNNLESILREMEFIFSDFGQKIQESTLDQLRKYIEDNESRIEIIDLTFRNDIVHLDFSLEGESYSIKKEVGVYGNHE